MRKARNMTQTQLAALLDVGITYISHVENGNKTMSIELINRLADALTCSPYQLLFSDSELTHEDEHRRIYQDELLTITKYRNLEELKYLLAIVRAHLPILDELKL